MLTFLQSVLLLSSTQKCPKNPKKAWQIFCYRSTSADINWQRLPSRSCLLLLLFVLVLWLVPCHPDVPPIPEPLWILRARAGTPDLPPACPPLASPAGGGPAQLRQSWRHGSGRPGVNLASLMISSFAGLHQHELQPGHRPLQLLKSRKWSKWIPESPELWV